MIRHRANLLRYRAAHVQHIQKILQQMNFKLTNVISDITGVTGFAIIRAIISGEHNPETLAIFRDGHCRCSLQDIIKSLQGTYLDEYLFKLTQAVGLYDFYLKQILDCDLRLSEFYERATPSPSADKPLKAPAKRYKRVSQNIPFDLRSCLYRLAGVDLTQVDGLSALSIQTILSETGIDMNKWPSVKHFTSWLSLAPNNKITGDKIISTASKKTPIALLRLFALPPEVYTTVKALLVLSIEESMLNTVLPWPILPLLTNLLVSSMLC